jgi:hypothetical protein
MRWSYIDRRCSERGDLHVARGDREMRLRGHQQSPRDRRRRRRFDDPGAGPSHAPPAAAGGELDDIFRRFETVF